uniref:Uncharacterized protein n=1 Tax=Glossina palpalis gambiensis TaxID=67801 RepID=A0A1B0B3M0_9MUSC
MAYRELHANEHCLEQLGTINRLCKGYRLLSLVYGVHGILSFGIIRPAQCEQQSNRPDITY